MGLKWQGIREIVFINVEMTNYYDRDDMGKRDELPLKVVIIK